MDKKLVSSLILAHFAQIWVTIFFFFFFFSKQNLAPSVIMVSYHHVQYQKNLRIQSWEVLDGQTDKSDFMKHCLPTTERPKRSGGVYLSAKLQQTLLHSLFKAFTYTFFISNNFKRFNICKSSYLMGVLLNKYSDYSGSILTILAK